MCGIAGIIYKDTQKICQRQTIDRMRDAMVHRGPDEEGTYLHRNVGLGHRRLSIIDLSNGRQPMSNEDGKIWIVYNGEIYNFLLLRKQLIAKGHLFKTNTDTEVILHLFEEKGIECVNDLNGMFAFAIYDEKDQTLFIARDRIGIKPVYYMETDRSFLFASEIKAFFHNENIQAQYNDSATHEYLLFRDIAGEQTLFKNVKRLLPGHFLILRKHKVRISPYWSIFHKTTSNRTNFGQAAEELDYLLDDAVKIRMISDVPLGTFCSGGIDSSLITAIASQYSNQMLNTYSVGFHESDFDETYYANIVSGKYETHHHELKVGNKEYASLLPEMIWHNDEPLNFANSIQIYAISKLSKQNVTVVLTGEGADELFAGYPRIQIPRLLAFFTKLPGFIASTLIKATEPLNNRRIIKLLNNLMLSPNDRLLYNSSVVDSQILKQIVPVFNIGNFIFRKSILQRTAEIRSDAISQMCLSDQSTYLASILNRQDKMSMAASIESRVPFLDYRIIEFANSLPSRFKHKNLKGKRILKTVASKYLPDEVIHRKKSGFGVPLAPWMRSNEGLGELIMDLPNNSRLPDFIDRKRLTSLIYEHRSEVVDHSEILWTLLNLTHWRAQFKV